MKKFRHLKDFERLSPLVMRLLGQNPGSQTLQGTNTYLVGHGPEVFLIDTGERDSAPYISLLSETLKRLNLSISSIIVTHGHGDHIGGCNDVLKLLQKRVEIYKCPCEAYDNAVQPSEYFSGISEVFEDQVVQVPGATLKVFHTPGHSVDSISLYLEEERSVFCGDSILGESSTDFDDYAAYMNTLEKYKSLSPERIYTGHGPVESVDIIDKYIAHRRHRESMILDALRAQTKEFSIEDLTREVYKNEPHVFDMPLLFLSATKIVRLICEKFRLDKSAEEVELGVWKSV